MQTRTLNVLFILLGVTLALAVWGVGWSRAKRAGQDAVPKKEITISVPEIVSCVNNIRVVKAEIKNPGTPDATAVVEVENTADIGIIAIAMEAAKGRETYGVTHGISFAINKEPMVVIAPHHTDTLTMAIRFPNTPIQIGGIMYADGTEEGCDSALQTLHELKDSELKRREKSQNKENPPQ